MDKYYLSKSAVRGNGGNRFIRRKFCDIAFLRQRYGVVEPGSQWPDFDLINDNFIEMWSVGVARRRHRQDLADSTAWIRSVRENEWSKSHR
ncbi:MULTISPECIES: hypothetical protein [Nostoc]|uniref:Uncharacterized protein n=1 Tax=Nostoc paludosum FACHB-159 TaxID=2692908 RepID=A0ABR8KBW2_9NOSO|nr:MULTISPECIES: hypothetical protein [Nostoc]MBD2680771.1 hypothetical protein [Nostoc sp. FACHB-857]MBD2736525.1 hypothetical protein [Nostoc paludosum FACHB-159]